MFDFNRRLVGSLCAILEHGLSDLSRIAARVDEKNERTYIACERIGTAHGRGQAGRREVLR